MTENKRYSEQNLENHLNRIYDNQEGKVIFDEDIVDLLNEQDERIRELEKENERLKGGLENKIKYKLQAKNAWKERYGDVE